jgi:ERCC4-type nuclease
VGDGIWIARHRKDHTEYVLDFIVERKEVLDLDGSIADSRYRDQKLRLKVPSELSSASDVLISLEPSLPSSFVLSA